MRKLAVAAVVLGLLGLTTLGASAAAPAAEKTSTPATKVKVEAASAAEVEALIVETRCGDDKREEAAAKQITRMVLDKRVPEGDPRVRKAMRDLLMVGHGDASFEAMHALLFMGMPSLDAGLEAVRSDNHTARVYGIDLLGTLARSYPDQIGKFDAAIAEVSKFMKGDDNSLKNNAVHALADMGPKAIPGLVLGLAEPAPSPAIQGLVNDLSVRGLAAMGKTAVPALLEAFRSKDQNVRLSAARALFWMKPGEAKEAIPAMLAATHDKEQGVRVGAALVLGRIGPDAKAVAPRLLEMIEAGDSFVTDGLAGLTIGPELVDRAVKLFPKLSDYESEKMSRALLTAGDTIVPRLAAALDTDDAATRRGVTFALYYFGPKAEPAVPALIKALDRQKPYDNTVARTLSKIGPGAKAAAPALVACLQQDRWDMSRAVNMLMHLSAAAQALGAIGKAAVPDLLRGLQSDNELVQAGCAQALATAGKGSEKDVVPALLELLKGKRHADVKGLAIGALMRLGADPAVLRPALEAMVAENADGRAVFWAREALDGLNKKGP